MAAPDVVGTVAAKPPSSPPALAGPAAPPHRPLVFTPDFFPMKKLLFAAAAAVAFLSAPLVQAQTTTASPIESTSMAPATDGWDWPVPVAAADATIPTAADDADAAMMRSSGVLVAPGMSSSPYRGTSTDYNGRPVARRKSFRPRSVRTTYIDPSMASSGVMLAPGMNTAPHRAASTDYHGRPLQQPQSAPASLATTALATTAPATDVPVVDTGW